MSRRKTYGLLALALLFLCSAAWALRSLSAQSSPSSQTPVELPAPVEISAKDSTVAHLEHNALLFPGGHEYFDSLYAQIYRLRCGEPEQLRVLHIGGSHVQAGVFPARMRKNLQMFNPEMPVQPGALFPFPLLKTNGPREFEFSATGLWKGCRNIEKNADQRMGVTGAAYTTSDLSATLTITTPQPFESVLLFGSSLVDTSVVYPVLVVEGDTIFPPRSSDEQQYEYLLPAPVNTCTLAFVGDSCGAFSLRGFVPNPYEPGILYQASGVNGAAVPTWLRCEAFEQELQTIAPDLAILAIGINDANVQKFYPEQFKQNYRQLLDRMRRLNPQCAFIFVTNNDCQLRIGKKRKRPFNKNTALAEKAFIELAEEYHGAVWNVYQIMGGLGSSAKWVKAGLMQSDYVHFSTAGYELMGDLLFNAIVENMKSPTP